MTRQRIYGVKKNSIGEEDRLSIANLLVKAGYSVRIGKELPEGAKKYEYFVEYWEES